MVNPYLPSSLEYVEREYPNVPEGVAIVILLNFRDTMVRNEKDPPPTLMKETKDFLVQKQGPKISIKDVQQLVMEIRENRAGFNSSNLFSLQGDNQEDVDIPAVHCFEVSMLNCYGLRELHQYLNLPFLRMKQQLLIEQLSRASGEMVSALNALEVGLVETKYHEFASTFAVKQKIAISKITENKEKQAIETPIAVTEDDEGHRGRKKGSTGGKDVTRINEIQDEEQKMTFTINPNENRRP